LFDTLKAEPGVYASPDWSSFDNHVYEELIVMAVAMLRSCYPDDERHDNYFLYMCSSLVFKNVVFEPGVVMRLDKGIPSGHPWTSIVDTLIN